MSFINLSLYRQKCFCICSQPKQFIQFCFSVVWFFTCICYKCSGTVCFLLFLNKTNVPSSVLPRLTSKYILCKVYPSWREGWNSGLLLVYLCWSLLAINHSMSKEDLK